MDNTYKVGVNIEFRLAERPNFHYKNGKEWALDMRFFDKTWWNITAWENKPKPETVHYTIDIVSRSFFIFSKHLYNLEYYIDNIIFNE